jgi:hypothetical protein
LSRSCKEKAANGMFPEEPGVPMSRLTSDS